MHGRRGLWEEAAFYGEAPSPGPPVPWPVLRPAPWSQGWAWVWRGRHAPPPRVRGPLVLLQAAPALPSAGLPPPQRGPVHQLQECQGPHGDVGDAGAVPDPAARARHGPTGVHTGPGVHAQVSPGRAAAVLRLDFGKLLQVCKVKPLARSRPDGVLPVRERDSGREADAPRRPRGHRLVPSVPSQPVLSVPPAPAVPVTGGGVRRLQGPSSPGRGLGLLS